MKTLKSLAIAATAAAGIATMGAGVIYAAQGPAGTQNRMSGLVSAISQKFHLNPTDVQKVFDEQHAQMETQMKAEREQHRKDRLTQAVKDGKLTQAQADAIAAKQTEIQSFVDGLKDKTQAERATAMKAQMDSLKQWAKENTIPEQFMLLGRGRFEDHGGRGSGKMEFGKIRDPKALLEQAMKDGKLTQAQADLISAKQTELKTFMVSLKDKTSSDRQAAINAQMDTLKQWAKDNGISEQFVMPLVGKMRGPGPAPLMQNG